jgi:hypothetical protein
VVNEINEMADLSAFFSRLKVIVHIEKDLMSSEKGKDRMAKYYKEMFSVPDSEQLFILGDVYGRTVDMKDDDVEFISTAKLTEEIPNIAAFNQYV